MRLKKQKTIRATITGTFLAAATLFGGAQQAAAGVLAENLHIDGQGSGNNHYSTGSVIGAENFTLSGSATIARISHVGHHTRGSAQPTSIDWWIFDDAAGTPGNVLASATGAAFSTAVEGTSGSYDLTRYIIDVFVPLPAGDYWVGFHNNGGAAGDPHWTFASSGTSFDGLSAISNDGGATWSTPYPGTNMTFRIEHGPEGVPAPATLALLALGAIAVGRRKK